MFYVEIRPFSPRWMFFIWYVDHWITPGLEAVVRGGGLRGYLSFYFSLFKCFFGYHDYIHVFRASIRSSTIECSHCKLIKEFKNDRHNI